jgi:DNA repair exonuclease SbcCD ATPase subunit
MQVQKLTIDNILGIEHLEIEPGAVTVIEGGNAVGKTSVLEAIKAALGGGNDATLLRQGAKEGSVVLILEDGTEIRKTVGPERSPVTVTHPAFGKISKPQGWLDKLSDALAVNPVSFLTAPPSKRAEWLLEVMPLTLEPDEATADLLKLAAFAGKDPKKDPLGAIEAARQALYDKRTAENRTAKDKKATAAQLRETLPPAEEVPADPTALRAELSSVEADRAGELQNAKTKCEHDVTQVNVETKKAEAAEEKLEDDEVAKIRLETERRIEEVRLVGRKRAEKRNAAAKDATSKAYSVAEEHVAAAVGKYAAPLAELAEKITKAETRRDEWNRAEKTREIIACSEKDAARAENESKALTASLERLEDVKTKLLEKLPIKGLEVRSGEIFFNGVPFDRLNRAQQVKLAIDIAKLRTSPLGLVAVDGLECLEPEAFTAFEKEAAKAGLQLVVCRVSSGPLKVRTVEAFRASVDVSPN